MGQITKVGKKYLARISVTQNGKRTRPSRIFDRKGEAGDWITAMEEQRRKGDIYTYSDQALPDYFSEWYHTYKEPTIRDTTKRRYESTFNLVKIYWHDQALNSIGYDDYQKFLNKLAKKYKIATIRKVHTQIRAAVTKAFQQHKIRDNFTDGAQISGKPSKSVEMKYLELNDIKSLKLHCVQHIQTMDNCPEIMILTALMTGIRYEEAIGLTWDNLDLSNGTMSIRRAYDYVGRQFTPTKTPASVRTITLNEQLIFALKKWRSIINQYILKTKFKNPNNFVFFTRQKNVPSNSYLNDRLRNYYQKLKVIHKQITYHGLRHSHASYLIAKHVSIQYVSKRLGHENVAITQQVYAHFLKVAELEEDSKAVNVLNEI